MGQVKLIITGDVRNLEQELTRAEKKIERLEQAAKRSGKALDGMGAAEAGPVAGRPAGPRAGFGAAYLPADRGLPSRTPVIARSPIEYLDQNRERARKALAAAAGSDSEVRASMGLPPVNTVSDTAHVAAARLAAEEARRDRDARANERLTREKAARDAERERMRANALVGGRRGGGRGGGSGGGSGGGGGGGGGPGADDDPLERFKREMGAGFDDVRAKADGLKTSAAGAGMAIGSLGPALLGATAGAYALSAAATAYAESVDRQASVATAARLKFDQMQRTAQVSSGLSVEQMGTIAPDVIELANKYAMEHGFAFDIIDAAQRSGMNMETVRGGGADAIAKVAAAMNATSPKKGDVDPGMLPKVLSGMLRAEGKPFDAAGIERIGGYARAAYAGQMELQDLPDLAKILATLRGAGLQTDESTAAFAALRDVAIPGAEASTGLRNVVGRLSRAGASNAKVKALRKMGLKPTDVDFQGEDLSTVLDRLAEGAGRLDPVARNIELTKIFEERGVATANTLLDPETRKRIRDYTRSMRQPGDLDRFSDLKRVGPSADAQRDENRREVVGLRDEPEAIAKRRLEMAQDIARERGESGFKADVRSFINRRVYEVLRLFGAAPEKAAEAAVTSTFPVSPYTPFDMRKAMLAREAAGKSAATAGRTDELLEQMLQVLKERLPGAPGPKPRAGAGGADR